MKVNSLTRQLRKVLLNKFSAKKFQYKLKDIKDNKWHLPQHEVGLKEYTRRT